MALALAIPACVASETGADEDPEVAAIAAALEEENGGLEMTDEAPAFGEHELMADATELEEEILDPIAEEDEVLQMQQAPDAVLFHTLILWGQFPGDPEMEQARNWSGALHVNRGAIIVNKAVAFEGPTDTLQPRPDPQTVVFTSATRPHHDGLRLTIIDPTPLSPEPLQLTYGTPDGPVVSLPMAALTQGPVHEVVDNLDNRVVAMAMPQPVDLCSHGMLAGRWHRLTPGRGRLAGPVLDPRGEPIGHVRGIFGKRANGEQVFFGKYINLQGQFVGIFAGRYGDDQFEGRWLNRAGDLGALGGRYRDTMIDPEGVGHFMGRWAETSCNAPPVGP
jgi:hypothetical protein